MQIRKAPIAHSDEPFLLALYSSTRQEELAAVPWTDEQKNAFLKMQFDAQHLHYTTKFPGVSLLLLKLNDQQIGRLYLSESDDEIKILDLTLASEFRNQKIGSQIISEIIRKADETKKDVQIYLENFNPAQRLFARSGFEIVSEDGFYQIWKYTAQDKPLESTPKENKMTA